MGRLGDLTDRTISRPNINGRNNQEDGLRCIIVAAGVVRVFLDGTRDFLRAEKGQHRPGLSKNTIPSITI